VQHAACTHTAHVKKKRKPVRHVIVSGNVRPVIKIRAREVLLNIAIGLLNLNPKVKQLELSIFLDYAASAIFLKKHAIKCIHRTYPNHQHFNQR
jgi:hypothetical protein